MMIMISCFPNNRNIVYPLGKRDVLLFLHSEAWKLDQICLDGNCKEVSMEDGYPFGIDTENVVPNYCGGEKGAFYTIGKYYYQTDPESFETSISIFSDPDYFTLQPTSASALLKRCCSKPGDAQYTLTESGNNGNEIKIQLCTPNGHYPGKLKIVDAVTIQIIANRPEYDNKEVIQVYKKILNR